MSDLPDPYVLPDDLPAPEDDGAADHLEGAAVPVLFLPATSGGQSTLRRPPKPRSSSIATRAPESRASRCPRAGTRSPARVAAHPNHVRFATTSPSWMRWGQASSG